jgi:hypothetical protein
MTDGDITIITTIHPAKKGVRAVTVMAAPDGEMPVCRTGLFADRHGLADQAYGELLKRKPQVVKSAKAGAGEKKIAKPKPARKPAKAKRAVPAAAQPDQIGPVEDADSGGTDISMGVAPDDLPVIEGDEEAQLELEGID